MEKRACDHRKGRYLSIECRISADGKVRELYDAATELTSYCPDDVSSSQQGWTAHKFLLYLFNLDKDQVVENSIIKEF